jgi:hypothetical protein
MATATHIQRNHRDLQPDERLELSALRDQVLSIARGVVYAVVGENDYILTSGDRLEISAGQPVRAWNAGDETVRVALSARVQPLAAVA